MPQSDIDRILDAINELRADLTGIKVELAEQITRLEERQRQQELALAEHRAAIAALEATRATSVALERVIAEQTVLKSQVKTIEDNALVEKGSRRTWGVILAAGGGAATLLLKTLLSYLPTLF